MIAIITRIQSFEAAHAWLGCVFTLCAVGAVEARGALTRVATVSAGGLTRSRVTTRQQRQATVVDCNRRH